MLAKIKKPPSKPEQTQQPLEVSTVGPVSSTGPLGIFAVTGWRALQKLAVAEARQALANDAAGRYVIYVMT